MRDTAAAPDRDGESSLYEIRIKGHLDDRWAERFGGMSLTHDSDGTTILAGPVVDQAALHGLLRTVRDLALPLVSVIRVDRVPPTVRVDAHPVRTPSKEEVDT